MVTYTRIMNKRKAIEVVFNDEEEQEKDAEPTQAQGPQMCEHQSLPEKHVSPTPEVVSTNEEGDEFGWYEE